MAGVKNTIKILENNGLEIGEIFTSTLVNNATNNITIDLPQLSANDFLISRTSTDNLENKIIVGGTTNNDITANNLATTNNPVNVISNPPGNNQILTANGINNAEWADYPITDFLFKNTLLVASNPSNPISGTSANLTNWTQTIPSTVDNSFFDPVSGIYTAPSNGLYRVRAVIGYSSTALLNLLLTGTQRFELIRVSDYFILSNGIISQISFTLLPIPIILPDGITVDTILGRGQVVLSGIFSLLAGDQIRLRFVSGSALSLNISDNNNNTTFNVIKIAE